MGEEKLLADKILHVCHDDTVQNSNLTAGFSAKEMQGVACECGIEVHITNT